MPDLSRRFLLGATLGLIASPAIVRASSLMPVKQMVRLVPFTPALDYFQTPPQMALALMEFTFQAEIEGRPVSLVAAVRMEPGMRYAQPKVERQADGSLKLVVVQS